MTSGFAPAIFPGKGRSRDGSLHDFDRRSLPARVRARRGDSFAIAQDAAADGLLAGEWHTVQTPEINGIIGPPQKGTRCLTPEAVADLDTTFSPVSRTTNSSCERVEHELTPQRLKWRLQCSGQIDMDVQGEFTFDSPEHYVAIITARSFMQGRLMQSVRTSIAGQRVGDCPQ